MVVGTLQHVPSKGRISIMKIQNFTVQKRHSVIKLSYGILLVIIGIVMAAIDPISIATTYYMGMREGTFLYNMWTEPTYELLNEMWVYNYTNSEAYISGTDKQLKVKEIGPFTYQEIRTNEHIKIDKDRGVMTMTPKMRLKYLPELSLGDTHNITVNIPNIPLIAISTLIADKLGYFANAGAYYSMSAMGSKLFRPMTIEQMFWGYHDPIVTLANRFLPGWIDFDTLGLLDRFYVDRGESSEVELGDEKRRYSLNTWANTSGLIEQGFTDLNTSTLCNRIKGSFEGLMLPPNYPKGKNITIFRKQACRNYPFSFKEEKVSEQGLNSFLYMMDDTAFSSKSPYACNCSKETCPPEGFVDVSNCYYGFPIVLSKPHYMDTDPLQQSYFEGMNPDPKKHLSYFELEPVIGAPLSFAIRIQINIAVRMSSGNTLTKPVKDKVLPLMWFSLFCKQPPADVTTLLRLRLVIAPPLMITAIVLLFLAGFFLGAQGLHRVIRPRYKIIPPKEPMRPIVRRRSSDRRKNSVILNMAENIGFKDDDDDLAKEAVSLLAIDEDDSEFVDLLLSSDNE